MRPIKFRAWNPDSKKMYFVPDEEGTSITMGNELGFVAQLHWYVSDRKSSVAYSDRSHLMQYTGIKDINGKEIYEGDIVHITTEDLVNLNYKTVVEWIPAGFWKEFTNFEMEEVIGNIYENPKLLT